MLRKINFILPIISAILLILAFPVYNLEFLAWIAFLPLFFSLEGKKTKERFLIGYIFGIVFFLGIIYWLFNVSILGTIGLVLFLSLLPSMFTSMCPPKMFDVKYAVFVPSVWVLTEYIRAHIFTGFPWALLGYSQSLNLPIIQIADITGVYGVSFIIVLVNFGIYLVLKRAPKRFYVLFFIFITFILALSYGQKRINQNYPIQDLKVAIIQGNIPQEIKWDMRYKDHILNKYEALTKNSARENPRFIVWPESSVPGYLNEELDLKRRIAKIAESQNVYLLVGTLEEKKNKFYNTATLISNKGKILKNYYKIHLVPFGEFIPLKEKFSWVRNLINKPIGDFDSGKDYTVFEFRLKNSIKAENTIHKTTEFFKFSVLICFEDIFPELSREFVKRGARFLVNITNDAWFGKTNAPYQHMQGSVFRAVENRVPVLRAANTGVSCIIEHTGKVQNSVNIENQKTFVDGYVVATIKSVFSKTIYTRFGDVFCFILFIFIAIILIIRKINPLLFLVFFGILLSSTAGYAEAEVYYRGELDLTVPFIKRYDYVTRVIDGDTIELKKMGRVRLVGIDTPEARYNSKLRRDAKRSGKDKKTIIEMGMKATKFTKSLAEGKKVRVEFDVEKKDRYGRWLAYIYLPDERMLNAELIKEGYAQIYTFVPNVKYVDRFLKLQEEARENNRGFWKEETAP